MCITGTYHAKLIGVGVICSLPWLSRVARRYVHSCHAAHWVSGCEVAQGEIFQNLPTRHFLTIGGAYRMSL